MARRQLIWVWAPLTWRLIGCRPRSWRLSAEQWPRPFRGINCLPRWRWRRQAGQRTKFGVRRAWSGLRMVGGRLKSRTKDIKSGRWRGKGVKIAPLYAHHDHPGMRDAYPNLANWPSVMSVHPAQRIYGLFRPHDVLTVYGPTLPWARHVGIHELKHMIDSVERNPPGGSWQQFMGPGVSVQEAYGQSSRLVGEVAARNARYRLDMKEQERRLQSPRSTESVPRDRQINLYDDD
jgi:hypothetical protein